MWKTLSHTNPKLIRSLLAVKIHRCFKYLVRLDSNVTQDIFLTGSQVRSRKKVKGRTKVETVNKVIKDLAVITEPKNKGLEHAKEWS